MASDAGQTDAAAGEGDGIVSLPVYEQHLSLAALLILGAVFVGVPVLVSLAEPALWPLVGPLIIGVVLGALFLYARRRRAARHVTLEPDGLRIESGQMRATGGSIFIPWSQIRLLQFASHVPRAIGEPGLLEGVEIVTADQRHCFVITPDPSASEHYRRLLLERAHRAFGTDHRTGEVIPPRDPEALAEAPRARALAEHTVRQFARMATWTFVGLTALLPLLATYIHLAFRPAGGGADMAWAVFGSTLVMAIMAALAAYLGHRRARRLRESWREAVDAAGVAV